MRKYASVLLLPVLLGGCVIAIDADDDPRSDWSDLDRDNGYTTRVSINDEGDAVEFRCATGYTSFLNKSEDGETLQYGCKLINNQ